jgi:hypothetical protein
MDKLTAIPGIKLSWSDPVLLSVEMLFNLYAFACFCADFWDAAFPLRSE